MKNIFKNYICLEMSSADFELQNSNLMAVTAVVETHSLRFNELTWMELL